MLFKQINKILLITILIALVFSAKQMNAEENKELIEKEKFEYAQSAIKQKALDVAKQIEIYIKLNPEKTVKDLQDDSYFQQIAVQQVGKTGYTAISDQDTSEQYFTPQKEIIGKKLEDFKDEIPVLWDFFEKELLGQCNDMGIFYDWPDSDGVLRKKYSYSVCIKIRTADGKRFGVDASTYLGEYEDENNIAQRQETFEELSVKLEALRIARQVEDYIKNNPDKTLQALQNDSVFQKIAVQQIGKTGYSAILNFDLIVKFHKQKELINFDAHLFENDFPELWEILSKSKGGNESSGYYFWEDEKGVSRKKYNYQVVVNKKTADNEGLIISATAYLDEYGSESLVNSVTQTENERTFLAKSSIKQKAIDVAKQIEIYIKTNPEKTVKDLQNDAYFQEIAVQQVGKTGYTAVNDYNTLITRFHVNPQIIDLDLSTLAEKLPDFWDLTYRTKGGQAVEGIYDWEEANGDIKQKYLYFAVINTKTADGVGLSVAATTYLDEYEKGFIPKQKQETIEELAIKLKALRTANQINDYLKENPELTLEELQHDKIFQNIAIQLVGETGYTGVIDSQTGYFYFHPQEILINTDSHQLKKKLPDFWKIFNDTIGNRCQESSGYYDWKEIDGTITKKYLYTSCVTHSTADGKNLFVGATTYINELDATKYLDKYKITNSSFSYARSLIDQRALDIAKQIELYLKANSQKTLDNLKEDEEFQKLAVQTVGKTGYTYLITEETGILNFHPDPKIRDTSYNSFKERFPVIWNIINKTIISDPCEDSSGFYEWADINSVIRDKYTYHHCINASTSDNQTFFIGASTYLDEYEELKEVYDLKHEEHSLEGRDDLLHLAQDEAKNIEIITNGFSRDIKSLAQVAGINKLLDQVTDEGVLTDTETEKKYYPKDKEKYWQEVQEYFLRFYQQNPDEIDLVRLFYKNGYIVNGIISGEEDANDYKGDKSWFKDVMNTSITKSNEVYISPISIARRTNSPAIRYAMPIDVNGERLGLIVINFKAKVILDILGNRNNVLFLDKAYENAEGEINRNWVVTLADSRSPEKTMNENEDFASVITSKQLIGDNGFLEFIENGESQTGAYQKINVSNREWYIVSFINSDKLETLIYRSDEISNVNFISYIYWFLAGLTVVFLVLGLLYYLKIIKLERTSLFVILILIFLLISGMFIFGSFSTVKKLKNHFKNSYIEQHLQLENILSGEVVELIGDMKTELKFLMETITNENTNNNQDHYNLLNGAYTRNKEYVHAIYRIDKNDIIEEMHPIDKTSIGADLSEQTHMKKVRETLKPVLSDVFDAVEGFQGVTLHYPIIKNGKYDGTVAFLINIDNFFNIISIFSSHIHPHESFLLDNNGQIIISDHNSYIGKNIFEIERHNEAKNDYKDILASDKYGFKEFVLEKEKQISTYAPINIEDNKWTIIINGKEDDAYSGIDSTLNSIWLFTLLALISFVIFGSLFSNFLTRSLRNEVEKKTLNIKNQSNKIQEQLKKEERITVEKEKLLIGQKLAKKELEEKIEELEKFQKLTVGRELKMIELKKKITELKEKNN